MRFKLKTKNWWEQPHNFFCLLPKRIDGHLVWLETVERSGVLEVVRHYDVNNIWGTKYVVRWTYKLIDKEEND